MTTDNTKFEFVQPISTLGDDYIVIDMTTGLTMSKASVLRIVKAPDNHFQLQSLKRDPAIAVKYARQHGKELYVTVDGLEHALTGAELIEVEPEPIEDRKVHVNVNHVAMGPSRYSHFSYAVITYITYDMLSGHRPGDAVAICGTIVDGLVCGVVPDHDGEHGYWIGEHGYWIGEMK